MHITVRNLGVIKEAKIDLKPLTILIGPNNGGKTWLAYALSGIFGQYGLENYVGAYIEGKVQETYPPLNAIIQQVLDEGNAKIDLVHFADEYGEAYINNVARFARQWMREFLSTELADFDRLEISLNLAQTKTILLERIRNISVKSDISVGLRKQSPLLSILKKEGESNLFIYTSTEGQRPEKLPDESIKERLIRIVLRVLHEAFYPNVYTFPTERTAFFILFPSAIIGTSIKFLLGKLLTTDEKSLRQAGEISGPLIYFLNMVSDTFQTGSAEKKERTKEAKKEPNIQEYVQLSRLLEKQILSGEVNFSTPEPDPKREILFTPNQGGMLEIAATSSMVKELSPLVLYLRYLAKPGELVIIDEPEMNLHPEAQAKLIEFLAMLVNAGLHVLITTHSPYVVDHLANLIAAAKNEDQETIRHEFYLQRSEAFIPQDKVSVYLVDQGRTQNMVDQDGIIHWGTFGEVSDRVSEIYSKL